MISLSIKTSFIVNTEPIEKNLNSIFTNKYGKVWCRMGNNEKFRKIMNSWILVFHSFTNICLSSVKFVNIMVSSYLITKEVFFSLF
jgi:hypothetical protein